MAEPTVVRLYRAATRVAVPMAAPLLKRRFVAKGGDPARWPERLGRDTAPRHDAPVIWVHAVSVGEMMSALPLIDALLAARPDARVLLTTTTATSAALAATRLPEGAIHRFAPLDTPAAVARFLDHWTPERAVFLESELWPNQIDALHRRGIPLALVSARLTEHSAAGWAKRPAIARWLFSRVPLILAQDADTATRARRLGASRVEVAGSLKSATARLPVDAAEADRLRAEIGARPIWLAASTHAGEEEAVAAAHATLREKHPDALLILAPRHPDRARELRPALGTAPIAQRSKGEPVTRSTAIYLADTLGEMGLWFALSRAVFLGGSLRAGIGGHNPLEPAAFDCAIVTGPHTANAEAEFQALGTVRVGDADALAREIAALLAPPRTELGEEIRHSDLAQRVAAAVLAL